jgi:hypothetical protein
LKVAACLIVLISLFHEIAVTVQIISYHYGVLSLLGGCRAGQSVTDRCGQRCVCSASRTLTQCTRIRKEFTSMTTAERERYVRVVKTASTNARFVMLLSVIIHLTIKFSSDKS